MNSNSDISSFKFTNDDEYIAAVGVDHSINVWLLSSDSSDSLMPKFMNQSKENFEKLENQYNETSFYDLELDEDRNLIYTHERNSPNSNT